MKYVVIIIIFLVLIFIYVYQSSRLFLSEKDKKEFYSGINFIDQVLNKHQISYFIICGTLLGAVRHQGIIPWDDDCDIGILKEDISKFRKLKFPYGVLFPTKEKWGKVYVNKNKKYIDIFIFELVDGKYMYSSNRAKKEWPNEYFLQDELFPLRRYKFGEIIVNGPNKFIPYCKRSWGVNWEKGVLKNELKQKIKIFQPWNWRKILKWEKTKYNIIPA